MSLLNPYAGHHKLETLFSRGVDFTNYVLYAPLWHPRSKVSPFVSFDKTGHTITVTSATWTPPYGYTLDGIDDKIAGDVLAVPTNMTFEAVLSVSDAGVRIIWAADVVGGYPGFLIYFNGTSLLFAIDQDAGSRRQWSCIYGIANGTRLHMVITQTGLDAPSMYINSVAKSVTLITDIGGFPTKPTQRWYFGANQAGTMNFYKGVISEIKIDSAVITQAQVTQHYLSVKRRLPWANLP